MNEHVKENNLHRFFSSVAFVLMSIFAGLTLGFMVGIVSTFVYLVIVFPILIGIFCGRMITDNVKYTKVRKSSLIRSMAILAAIIVFGTTFYVRYLGLQVITSRQAFGDLSDKSLKAANAFVNYALEEETGHQGFVGYILFKANQGVSIGRIFSSNALNLGPIFTWLYWLVELGVIIFITVHVSKEISKKPFCENCNAWYEGKRHIGGARLGGELEIRNLIKLHDFAAVGKMLEENMDVPGLELYLQSCKTCEKSAAFLTVTKTGREKGRLVFTDLLDSTLSPQENKLLLEGINFAENQGIAREREIASSGRASSSQ